MRIRVDWSTVHDLGKVPDAAIAARIGCSPSAVKRARFVRGILLHPNWRSRQRCGVDWSEQPLGVVPDEVISRNLGVHVQTVVRARMRLGISRVPTRRTVVDLPRPVYFWMRKQHRNMTANDAAIAILTQAAIDAGVKFGGKQR